MIEWTLTQVVAAAFWFNGQATVRSVAEYLGICEKDVEKIRQSGEYRGNVKTLMLASRSEATVKKWIQTYYYENSEKFANRMGLEPDEAEKIVEEVLSSLP